MTIDERAVATEATVNTLLETLATQFATMNERISDLRAAMIIGFSLVGAILAAELTALIIIALKLP
jgi:hypothetical protein